MLKYPLLFASLFLGMLSATAQSLVIIAGTGTGGYNGDTIPAVTAELSNPTGVVVDARHNVFVADANNNRVRRIDSSGIITTIAGTGVFSYTGDSSAATAATLSYPIGLALDPSGNLYIADAYNGAIRKVDTAGIITTLVNGLKVPTGIVFDSRGNLYITEQTGDRITKLDTLGNETRIAGTDTMGESGNNGPATAAQIDHPYAICFDQAGNLYFSDLSNAVRKIDTAGIITAVAGADTSGYNGDGIAADTAYLNVPEGVLFDKQGNLYIADGANNRIRKVDTAGIITTYIGPGGLIPDSIGFESSLTFDPYGHMYLLDATGNYVRELIPGPAPVAGFSAAPDTICAGSSVNFSDTSSGSPNSRLWTFTGGTPGTSNAQNPLITYNIAGIYPVKLLVSNTSGADSLTKYGYIVVRPLPVPVLTAADTLICAGDSTQVCTADTFTSYRWNTGSISYCTFAKDAGGYWVTVTDADHCSAVSGHREISVYPVPSVSITVEGDTLSSFGQVSYQWNLDGEPVSGATGPVFVANGGGSYTVAVTDTNGCTTISEPVVLTGISGLSAIGGFVNVLPNPSVDNWQLTVDNELVGSALEVFDEQGRLIMKDELRTTKYELTATTLSSGVYYLRISNASGRVVKKLVKM